MPTRDQLSSSEGPLNELRLIGPGLHFLEGDRLAMLEQMLGGLGIYVGGQPVDTTPTILATRDDFLNHAQVMPETERLASLTWFAVTITAFGYGAEKSPFPPVRFIDKGPPGLLDLGSVRDRLDVSHNSPSAWHRGSKRKVAFLRSIVSAHLLSSSAAIFDP